MPVEDADGVAVMVGRLSLVLFEVFIGRSMLDAAFGITLYFLSFSLSTTRSSRASSSVPSPHVRADLGFFMSFGPVGTALGRTIRDGDATRALANGTGDVLDCLEGGDDDDDGAGWPGNTEDIGTRDLARELNVGIVSRVVPGESIGVVGRGTWTNREVRDGRSAWAVAAFAREDAVGTL